MLANALIVKGNEVARHVGRAGAGKDKIETRARTFKQMFLESSLCLLCVHVCGVLVRIICIEACVGVSVSSDGESGSRLTLQHHTKINIRA